MTSPEPPRLTLIAQGTARFRPRARLLKTIGAELISSETVAVIELVRNSYDADATRVDISFNDAHTPGKGTIEIRDNGHGMSREVLLGPWLEPATDHKAEGDREGLTRGLSPRGRRQLGSKGVGRFAAQKLGSHLSVFTRVVGQDRELRADFDWERLTGREYLEDVEIPWSERGPEHLTEGNGTALVITGVRDGWHEARYERLRLGLGRLISPEHTQEDPFQIVLHLDGDPQPVKVATDAFPPMYSIKGTVQDGGQCRIEWRGFQGEVEVLHRTVVWPEDGQACGPLRFQLNAWDLDKETLEPFVRATGTQQGMRELRRTIREHSGVSLYRDGFRILPYGEPDNDWLRLDRRRVNNPTLRLSNNQLLGWVHLTASANPHLQDQTNREGLVTNAAYEHLQKVVTELISYLENRRFGSRRTLVSRGETTNSVGEHSRLAVAIQKVKEQKTADSRALEELEDAAREQHREAARAIQQYASLAAAGQLTTMVFSQLQGPLERIRSELKTLAADLGSGPLPADEVDDLKDSIARTLEHVVDLSARVRRLDPFAVARTNLKPVRTSPVEVFDPVLAALKDRLASANVKLHRRGLDTPPRDLYPTLLQQVAALLLDNAIYWSAQNPRDRLITLTLTPTGFQLDNNGPPIAAADYPHLFDPGFTRREGAAGMGLTIARELMRSIGGDIHTEPLTLGARFVVRG